MNPHPHRSPARQQGVVLFIALIVLVAMSLAGVAMVRSVDTSLGIAGNLAFKQATIQGSDLGIREAYTWLSGNTSAVLKDSDAANGYFSAAPASTAEDWFDASKWGTSKYVNGGAADAAGNVVRYVIHRMCTEPNTAYNGTNAGVPNNCALNTPTSGGGSGGSMAVGSPQFQGIPQIYYRITTRVEGPRNTVSIVQVSVLFRI
jgi:type IV pilus assembly protein PilX